MSDGDLNQAELERAVVAAAREWRSCDRVGRGTKRALGALKHSVDALESFVSLPSHVSYSPHPSGSLGQRLSGLLETQAPAPDPPPDEAVYPPPPAPTPVPPLEARAWWAQPPPPFLNDLLGGCQAVGALWRHQEEDGVGYLPASPALHDKASALGWLAGPPSDDFTWVGGFAWLLEALCAEMPTLTDVVVDLPPGLCGFAHQVLAFTSNLERRLPLPSGFPDWPAHTPLSPEYVRPGAGNMVWRCNAMLITTPDRGDLAAAAEYATRFREELGHLRLILNRSRCVFGVLGEQYDQTVRQMRHVEEIPTLGRVFRSGGLTLTDRVRELRVPLGLGRDQDSVIAPRVCQHLRGAERAPR